jgi:hypothetical protein
MITPTPLAPFDAALAEMRRPDWDALGTTSAHLPRAIAIQIVEQSGYFGVRLSEYHGGEYEGPHGMRYELDEALTLALVAQAIKGERAAAEVALERAAAAEEEAEADRELADMSYAERCEDAARAQGLGPFLDARGWAVEQTGGFTMVAVKRLGERDAWSVTAEGERYLACRCDWDHLGDGTVSDEPPESAYRHDLTLSDALALGEAR